jgi:uncharacterized protein
LEGETTRIRFHPERWLGDFGAVFSTRWGDRIAYMTNRADLPWPAVAKSVADSDMMDRAWSPEAFHVLAKPTGAICNLGCSYCFFLDKEELYEGSRFHMSDDDLDRYIKQLIDAHSSPVVTVAWQGGEPTLMGLDFYRRAIEVQERYAKPGMRFENTLQTNGTLLTDEWCEFLKENDYLIGISIDGPQPLHDVNRVNKRGEGTFDKVMRGLRLLQKHEVEYNVLTTVNSVNGAFPLEVYRFLRDDVGTDWMQFIPVVERVDAEGNPAFLDGTLVSDRSVGAEQFGRFLSVIFDEWVRKDVGQVYVQTFEATVRNWMGLPSSGMCVFNETCGLGVALEHNGDVYSCDHFVEPEYLIGNIGETPMGDLVGSQRQYDFGMDKRDDLPQYCLDCDVRFACHGECPKNRFIETPDGEPGLNYLCAGFKDFFHHVSDPMDVMVKTIKAGESGVPVMEYMAERDREFASAMAEAGRNRPCPCGSGLKTKRCHGASQMEQEPVPEMPTAPGAPRPKVRDKAKS